MQSSIITVYKSFLSSGWPSSTSTLISTSKVPGLVLEGRTTTPGILDWGSASTSFSAASAIGTSANIAVPSGFVYPLTWSGGILTDMRPWKRWTRYSSSGPNLETPSVVSSTRSVVSCFGRSKNMLKLRVFLTGRAAACWIQAIVTNASTIRAIIEDPRPRSVTREPALSLAVFAPTSKLS